MRVADFMGAANDGFLGVGRWALGIDDVNSQHPTPKPPRVPLPPLPPCSCLTYCWHYSGSGFPFVSGMNGTVAKPMRKTRHIVTPA
jgi:hypothetical protein